MFANIKIYIKKMFANIKNRMNLMFANTFFDGLLYGIDDSYFLIGMIWNVYSMSLA